MPPRAVQLTRELQRVLLLPRRVWREDENFARELTAVLRRKGGTQILRCVQAQALYDMQHGGFCSIRVGGGKTLLSLLAPYVLKSRRPLLLLPAKLVEKTQREMRVLAQHWPIPNFIRIISYELLGRTQSAEVLDRYQPDLIVADEAHKLKNTRAAVTKRVKRYMQEKPGTRFVPMSGTITKRSLKDYAHLLQWSLKASNMPIPGVWHELEEWADALDEKDSSTEPGALRAFCTDVESRYADQKNAVRVAFRRRLTETPGVVATSERFLGASIQVSKIPVHLGKETTNALHKLRNDWELPDGQVLADPLQVWRHVRELALGFYYHWDPVPPPEWIAIRKDWAALCREILTGNRRNLDSELQVTNAVDAGYYSHAVPFLRAWRSVKKTFELITVPVWVDQKPLDVCAAWALDNIGIIWCEHVAFAEKIAKLAKLSYYGSGGVDVRGRVIEDHSPEMPMIASVASNSEGRNLQKWSRNLWTSCPANGTLAEQNMGRTHREGQLADEVSFDVLHSDQCHTEAMQRTLADARYVEASTGQAQKILYADLDYPGV